MSIINTFFFEKLFPKYLTSITTGKKKKNRIRHNGCTRFFFYEVCFFLT